MPARSHHETIIGIYQSFLRRRTWRQAELARELGLTPEGLRKRLLELQREGAPLRAEVEHPHVVWSMPKDWLPGGLALDAQDTLALVRVLLRAPRSAERDAWVNRVATTVAPQLAASARPVGDATDEPAALRIVEESLLQRQALRMRYHSRSKADPSWRTVSVQHIDAQPPGRFGALCHQSGALRWFRVDRVYSAMLDRASWWREADAAQVRALLEESLHGFREEAARDHVFFVRAPEADWVRHNLPARGEVQEKPGGVRVTIRTGAPSVLARFVVGLGEAARAESDDLKARVRALAEGALRTGGSAVE